MRIFIICSVRGVTDEYKTKLESYATQLELQGHKVHLPHRDTNQSASGYDICIQNRTAIVFADEVHIFYSPNSQGTHFDLGVAFTLSKKIVIVENGEVTEGKSFPRMLEEWSNKITINNV